jgi:biopolymer transport protein ExbD
MKRASIEKGENEEASEINVVPLADLTLVLLIILMVLSPMISQSMIRVATPQVQSSGSGEAGGSGEEKVPLLVSIGEKGYSLNNVAFEDVETLFGGLKEKLQEDSGRPVIVMADDGVFVGQVVEVVDRAKQMGAKEVSLIKSVAVEKKK